MAISLQEFKKGPWQRVKYFEWNALVDVWEKSYKAALGYFDTDIKPTEDGKFTIGKENLRFYNIFSYRGDFKEQVLVNGRPVLKDGDPISIMYIYEGAREQITKAIDLSSVPSKMDVINQYLNQIREGVSISDIQDVAKGKIRDAIIEAVRKDLIDIKLKLQELRAEVDELYTKTFSKVFSGLSGSDSLILFYPTSGKSIKTRSWFLHSDSTKGAFFLWGPVSRKYIGALFCTRSGVSQHNRARIELGIDEPIELVWDGIDTNSSIIVQITYKEE